MPEIIAHRGNSAHAPENTLAAFRSACRAGADRIELDVRPSADGVPFVFHDLELSRLTDHTGRSVERTMDELASIRVACERPRNEADSVIPSLDRVLDEVGSSIDLYIEIKTDGIAAADAQALTKACLDRIPADGRHVLASFAWPVVRTVLEAGAPAVWILDDPSPLASVDPSGLTALSVRHDRIDAAFVRRCQALDIPLWAWTVDTPEQFERLASVGAERAWCTNDVPALVTWLAERGDR